MDKLVPVVINGDAHYLNYSIEVMFDVNDKYGGIREALELMSGDKRESFEVVRWFLVHMANDGELCRRMHGYDNGPMLEEKDVSLRISPLEYATLKSAVVDAINRGYLRETADPNQEVDLGLEEIRSKKTEAGG